MGTSAPALKGIHPKKFALWVGLVSITMMFAALTSAYIVRKAAGNWLYFPLPTEFFYSTAAILTSSLSLYTAFRYYLQENYTSFKLFLVTGFVLGFAFVVLQYQGWNSLNAIGVMVHTNQSSSFLYLITGIHVVHVLGGIAALTVALIYGLLPKFQAKTPKRQLRLELIFTYWHFVDFLWLYLFIFFLLQQ